MRPRRTGGKHQSTFHVTHRRVSATLKLAAEIEPSRWGEGARVALIRHHLEQALEACREVARLRAGGNLDTMRRGHHDG